MTFDFDFASPEVIAKKKLAKVTPLKKSSYFLRLIPPALVNGSKDNKL